MDTLPSTHYHTPFVQRFNQEARTGNQPPLDLSPESLLALARQETGLQDFADDSFLPVMRTLLKSAQEEADLNPFGRFIARTRTLRSLKNRLWADACFAARAEIRERKIPAPIIIVGPHRSGTTRLQHMLACDSRLQALSTWEGTNPAPRPGSADAGRAARYEEVREGLAARQHLYPGAFDAHPMEAEWPEEEMLLLNHSFCGFSPLGLYDVPSYYRWFIDGDKTFGYRYMADLMKLIADSRGAAGERRWILKNPQHMLDLDLLLAVFPDAKLIFTHRDPIKTVGSVLSLMWFYAVQHTDRPCRAPLRDVWLDFCEQMARRCIKSRQHIPAAQQLDVYYDEINRDWRAAMRKIYAFADLEFTAETEAAQAAWLDNSAGRHGSHRYALEDFGTSAGEVDERLAFLREKYAIPYEGR